MATANGNGDGTGNGTGNNAVAPAGDPFIPDRPLDAGAAAGARPASEIVKQVRTVMDVQDVSEVVRPAVPGPWLAVVHPGDRGMDRVERWSTNEWKPSGDARIARGPNGNRYALSPDGDSLAYISDFPGLSVQVWSFGASRVSRTIQLNQNLGQPTLLGFSRPDQVLLQWRLNGQVSLEVLNTKSVVAPRRFEVVNFTGATGSYAISPDGQNITVVTRGMQQAALASYALSGSRGAREVPITEIRVPQFRTTALAYTPDGNKIAALFEANGQALFVVWPAAGRATRSLWNHVLASGLQPRPCADGFAPSFDDHAFEWLDDGDTYLLYGSSVVDAHSGSFLGDLELGGVLSQSSAGPGVVELVRSPEEGKTRIDLVTLDLSKLGSRAAPGNRAITGGRPGPAVPRPSTRGAAGASSATTPRGAGT